MYGDACSTLLCDHLRRHRKRHRSTPHTLYGSLAAVQRLHRPSRTHGVLHRLLHRRVRRVSRRTRRCHRRPERLHHRQGLGGDSTKASTGVARLLAPSVVDRTRRRRRRVEEVEQGEEDRPSSPADRHVDTRLVQLRHPLSASFRLLRPVERPACRTCADVIGRRPVGGSVLHVDAVHFRFCCELLPVHGQRKRVPRSVETSRALRSGDGTQGEPTGNGVDAGGCPRHDRRLMALRVNRVLCGRRLFIILQYNDVIVIAYFNVHTFLRHQETVAVGSIKRRRNFCNFVFCLQLYILLHFIAIRHVRFVIFTLRHYDVIDL